MKPEILSALEFLESEPYNPEALARSAALLRTPAAGEDIAELEGALRRARQNHRERGEFEIVVALLDLELAWSSSLHADTSRRVELLIEKGRVLSEELWRQEAADECFRTALELHPGDEQVTALQAQASLVRDNLARIAEKYREELQAATDRSLAAGLMVSLAELGAKYDATVAGEPVLDLLRRALESDPRNKKAAAYLERQLRAQERWSELDRFFTDRVEAVVTREERVGVLISLAALEKNQLGRPERALAALQRALAVDAVHPRALKNLADAYIGAENWTALEKLYETALKARPRGELEQSLLLDFGTHLWRRVGKLESAEECFRKVRQRDPAHPLALEFYRAFYTRRGEGAKLLQVLGQAQKIEPDEQKRLQLSIEMAHIAESSGGSLEKAIDLWKSVFKLDRNHPEAGAALKRLYQRTEKWNALLELLKEQIDALSRDPETLDERIERLLEVVAIYRDKLGLDVMVVNTYNTILQLRPEHEGALVALAVKYEQMGRWNDLIGVLQRQAELEKNVPEKARLLRRIASLWVERFSNHNQAIKPLEELYELMPSDTDVVVRLRDIYTKRRAWRALLDLERRELDRMSPGERRDKLIEISRLAAERLGDPHEAIALWNRILEDDPGDTEAVAALVQLYERDKRYPALAEMLDRQCKHTSDPRQLLPLLEKLGALWAERLGVMHKAIEVYQGILRIVPKHPKTMRLLRDLYAQSGNTAELEALYGAAGQWEELCETLLAVAERSTDMAQKLQLYQRVALIAQRELGQPERAAKAYERVLAVEPRHLGAARSLVPIYRRGEKWARLLAMYEIVLSHAQDDLTRLELHREIRTLCEEKLGSRQLAFTWCANAYAIAPDNADLEQELERLAREADAYDQLVEIYTARAALLPEGPRKVARLRQLANLLFTKLNRADEAKRYYGEVLERVPGDPQALAALEQIYTQSSSWEELLAIYEQRLRVVEERDKRLELLFKVAYIEEEKRARIDAAAAAYRAVLDQEPASLRALRALERIYAAQSNWKELCEVLERRLALSSEDADSEVALAYELGELWTHKLGDAARALTFYQRAIVRQPLHRPTITALERYLVPEAPDRGEIARKLVSVYEKTDEVDRLVQVLDILRGEAAGRDRDEELVLERRLVSLLGRRLGRVEDAFQHAVRIFELMPGDIAMRRDLVDLADLIENHAVLVGHLAAAEQRLRQESAGSEERTPGRVLARDLAWEQAGLLEQRLHDTRGAEAAYRRVLELDEAHEGALLALDRIYRSGSRHRELRDHLVRRKELAVDVAVRCNLLFEICALEEGPLDDEKAAIESYLEVLHYDPESLRAYKALERLYAAAENWVALDELLGREVAHLTEAVERAQLKARRGDLHNLRLDDAAGACDFYEEALADDVTNEMARRGLEKLMSRPELRLRIAQRLEPMYLADGAWAKLVAALQAQREFADGVQAVELLGRIARLIEERLGSRQQAYAVWREALLLDPSCEEPRTQVERLALILEKFQELAQTWLEAEQRALPGDLTLRGQLLRKAALIFDEDLGLQEQAIGPYRQLLELDRTNLITARPAAQSLERIYQSRAEWSELIEMLRLQAEWSEAVADKKEYLRRIAVTQETQQGDRAAAVTTRNELLDLDPEDRDALDALERLYAALEQWSELVGILERRVALAPSAVARRELRWRIAELTEHKLGFGPGSSEIIAAYGAVLDEQADDTAALDALARHFEAAERPVDLLETLERRLGLEPQVAGRVKLRGRIAALLEGPLGRLDQALERYREMLADDPDNEAARQGLVRMLGDADLRLHAAEVLEPIYEGRGDRLRLIELCELWAEHAPDLQERVARLRRIATLRQRAGELPEAFNALSQAARLAVAEPELPMLLDALEALASAEGGKLRGELIALYRDLGADILDAELKESVYLAVAAESQAMGDRQTAREYYRRVLDATPEHPRALAALETLYADNDEYQQLLEIYNRRGELAGDDEDQRRHYLALAARLCRDQLGRPEESISCFEQILQLFPADVEAADALDALYTSSGRYADLANLLERRLGFTDDVKAAVELHIRLGDLLGKELVDGERAVEHYRAALSGDADHPKAIAALERYLDDLTLRTEAAEVLEPVYAARYDWRALIRIYEIRLEAAEDTQERLHLTKRIARAFEEQLEDLEASFRWYCKVFREDPTDRQTRDQLARLAGILDCHEELAAVYDDYLADTYEETPASIEVLRTVAQIYDYRLGNVDRAKTAYLRLLRHDPTDQVAFRALETMLTRAERYHDLLEVYREAADGALELAKRKELLYRICHVYELALRDPDAAIDSYRVVLDLDEEDAKSMAALDRLYTAGKRWHDLVELLQRQLDRADSTRQIQIKLRLGGIFEKELLDLPTAIDAYEEVLRAQPRNREAMAALERLILDRDQRFRIAQILEPLYRDEDQWAKLIVIYNAELEFIDDKQKRVELLCEVARLHGERGGDLHLAFEALAHAWEEEASEGEDREAPLYRRLLESARPVGAWSELVEVLENAVAGSYDSELVARVHARVAKVHQEQRGDGAAAVESWRKVVAVREDDIDAWKALERLLAQLGRTEELVDVLEKRAELTADIDEQKTLVRRTAELYEAALKQPEQAIAAWRQVLSLDDADRAALKALVRLYEADGAWRDLAWVYGRQIELGGSEQERRPLRFAMARVFEEHLGDHMEAIAAYKGVLEEEPRDREALEALCRLYEKEALWPELLETLDALAPLLPPGTGRDAVRMQAAKVLEDKQSEPDQAIERYRQILADTPTHAGAREALEALVLREETRDQAAQVLEPFYRMRGEFRPLVDLYELKLRHDNEPAERRILLGQIAELQESGLNAPSRAFAAWGRLLEEEPSHPEPYLQLERLAEKHDFWNELVGCYEERLAQVLDSEVQRQLALRLAHVCERRLGDDERAISRYRQVLELGGDEVEPLAELDRLLAKNNRHLDLAQVIEREAVTVGEPERQADFLHRLGLLRQDALGDLDGALTAYRDALDRMPTHPGARQDLERLLDSPAHARAALDILEQLYESEGNPLKRIDLAEVRLGLTEPRGERAALLQQIARLYEEHLHARADALDIMVRALEETPEDLQIAEEVERLATPDQLVRAAHAFHEVLERGVPSSTVRDLGLRAARLYERLDNIARAEAHYVAVLDVDPENLEALEALERIFRRLGDMAQLVDVLERRGELELDLRTKKQMHTEVARLKQSELGDDEGAIAAWRHVLDADEADKQALMALAALYEASANTSQLVEVLEQLARYTESVPEQITLKTRIGTLYAKPSGNLDKAIDAYRDVLDMAPDSLAVLAELEALYERRGDWLAVQETLVRRLGVMNVGREQLPIYRRLARLAIEQQKSPEDAIGYYQQILELAPEELTVYAELEELLERLGKWYDLVDTLKQHAGLLERAGDSKGALKQLARAAGILDAHLSDPEAASEILERILGHDPHNVPALTTLAQIYENQGEIDKCVATLERAVAMASSGGGRDLAELEFRLGRLTQSRQGEDAAETFYRRAHAADATHPGAAEALERLARNKGDWASVASLLDERARRAAGAEQKKLLLELADIARTKLGDRALALDALERAHVLAADEPAILEPLADAYLEAGRRSEALPIYRGLVERIGKGRRTKELARLQFRVGSIAEQEGNRELALEQYQAAYQIDASHAPTLAALGRLWTEASEWEKARRIYRSMLLQNLDPAQGVSKADVYLQLGLIHEKLNETSKAVGMYERGLEVSPQHAELKASLTRTRGGK